MKYCSKCGFSNEDNAAFCASCGENVQDSVPQAPAQAPTETYYTPPVQTPVYTNQEPVSTDGKNPATLWLILNIVATVICCGNLINIVGIIFAAIGMGSFNKGEYADAESKTKTAKILFWVGLGLGVLSLIIGLAAGLLPLILSIMDSSYYY